LEEWQDKNQELEGVIQKFRQISSARQLRRWEKQFNEGKTD